MAKKLPENPQSVYIVAFELPDDSVRYLCVNATGGYVFSFNTAEEMDRTAVAPLTFASASDARKAVRLHAADYKRVYGAKSKILDSRNIWADWYLLDIVAKCPYAVAPRSRLGAR